MASRYKRLADDLDMVRRAPRKNNKKRNIRRKKDNRPRRFLGSRAARIALAALLVVGGAKVYDWIQTSQATIAKVVDYSGDEYDGKMPIYDENGKLIAEIDENSLVVTISKLPKDESERVYVGAINSNGESIIGQTERRYLEEVQKVDKDKIEEYSTVYTVIPDSGVNIKTVGIVGLIAIGLIIIIAAMSFMPSGSDVVEKVTISVTQTESYATNEVNYTTANLTETGNLEYWYYVNANIYPSDLSMDLEEYDAKITFYSGSEVITAVEAYIYKYDDGTFDVSGSYTTKELSNVTDIQIEVINPTGDIVGSQKSQFTMGDMTTARFFRQVV